MIQWGNYLIIKKRRWASVGNLWTLVGRGGTGLGAYVTLGVMGIFRMSDQKKSKRSGYWFIAAGATFFVAAFVGKQTVFYGVGAVYFALGAMKLRNET